MLGLFKKYPPEYIEFELDISEYTMLQIVTIANIAHCIDVCLFPKCLINHKTMQSIYNSDTLSVEQKQTVMRRYAPELETQEWIIGIINNTHMGDTEQSDDEKTTDNNNEQFQDIEIKTMSDSDKTEAKYAFYS